MKTHTGQFKANLIELGRELKGVITYGNTTLEEEIYSITPHYNADLLKSVMKQLDLELSVDIPLETVINCQIGIKVGNDYEMLNFGNYVVYDSEKQEDEGTYKITCYDKLLYSMKQNEDLEVEYPISIKNYLTALANKIGLTVASQTFNNSSLTIPSELYLGLEYTYRDILDEIAQATGSIICLNQNDEIIVKYPTTTNDTIDEDFLKDVNVDFGQKYGVINSIVLSRSGESDNVYLRDEDSVAENGLTEIKIVDNQIMNFNNRSDFLSGILNALDGLYYYINDFNSTGILYYEVGDLYNVQIGENTYQCLMLNDEINITTGIEEIVHTDIPQKSETDYSKADKTDMRINQTYLIVDKQNQRIDSVVNTVTEQNSKISQITQTVDELNSKIQDIADITTYGESDRAVVELTGINQSEPIMLKVHPTSTNISYLYPRSNLYPSDLQYLPNRKIRFVRTYEEEGQTLTENIDYELPDDLLRYSSTVYDEFYLDYDSQTCQVTKRCAYNADGTVRVLGTEIVTDYPYPQILLNDGDYEIQLLGYDFGYLYVRLMAQNIYTTQFATKAEMRSEINQTAESINLEVSQKIGEDEVVSSINQSADKIVLRSNRIAIQSDNFQLTEEGRITATEGVIGGFGLGTNQFIANLTSEKMAKYTYNQNDRTRIRNIIMGNITPTDVDYDKYDFTYTGFISTIDYLIVTRIINGTENGRASFILDTKNSEKAIAIKDSNGNEVLNLGRFGSYIQTLTVSNLNAASLDLEGGMVVNNPNNTTNPTSSGIWIGNGGIPNSDDDAPEIYLENNSGAITIQLWGYNGLIECVRLTQTSLEENKKNFKKLENNKALQIILDTDIYTYNLKDEDDKAKKHLGFVIGENYNYSQEITSEENNGVDNYSMISAAYGAIKELYLEIQQMKKEIKELKRRDK